MHKIASINSDEDIQEETRRKNKLTAVTDLGSLESGTTRDDDDGKRVVSINEAFELSGGFGRYQRFSALMLILTMCLS